MVVLQNTFLILGFIYLGTNAQISFPGSSGNFANSENRGNINNGGRNRGCQSGVCQPVVDCAGRMTLSERSFNKCTLENFQPGLCCRLLSNRDVNAFNVRETAQRSQTCPANVAANPLLRTASFSTSDRFPVTVLRSANQIPESSSAFFHNGHQAPKAGALLSSKIALTGLQSARESFVLPFENGQCTTRTENIVFDQNCPRSPRCNPNEKYRNPRGLCNNLRQPLFGAVFTPVQRILRNAYFDGFEIPRRDSNGSPLPSARLVSTSITRKNKNTASQYTNILMSMGQFLDHDLVHVPVHRLDNGDTIDCCSTRFGNNSLQCFPISIPRGDISFGSRTCINFVRSLSAPDLDCNPGPNEQLNQLTHWIDGSNIYGSTQEETNKLRSFRGGKLRMMRSSLLPEDNENEECVDEFECFLAGDSRVNEQLTLAVMHTLWVRQHNKVADELAQFNPFWNDETLFQEAKRIVSAQWQHVIFNEWLPVMLGPTMMESFGLWTLRRGFSFDYRNDFDPRITNEFAAAGFRVGHTLIPSFLKAYSLISSRLTRRWQLRSIFNDPGVLETPGVFDEVALGMVIQNVEDFDNSFTEEITDHLFERNGDGLDLIALNIQRARDHGIPGYVRYREICGLGRARTFEDLGSNISRRKIAQLKSIYKSVDDIDLFIGMTLEDKFRDAFIGRTFLCIISDQFARLKKGDRYFYDLSNQAGSFTSAQLDEIRKFSLSRLICDNTNIKEIQPLALEQPDNIYNILTPCRSSAIPKTNLFPWTV
ncbi:salivary peroxidase/catechol oxidase [Lepeophtheirus salmonis]|uniref:salivary peroxidase/catechol oxidase n=1 Tax=Lepeophtheirus salmonis TaxID=72036 RepID=UPI001AE28D77|nr:chorion peroxidase-like [Lepeophtheirus salmonis]